MEFVHWYLQGEIVLYNQVVLGPQGIINGISSGKGYVDMSTIDPETSKELEQVLALNCCSALLDYTTNQSFLNSLVRLVVLPYAFC